MSVQWNATALPLDRLYGVQTGYVDNAILTEYDSGRVVSVAKDTRNRRRYSVSYAATKTQEQAFFTWYENTLHGNAGTFTAASLRGNGQQQEYRLEGTPTTSGTGAIRSIDMVWVEA